jgi:predicted phage-related endonuclease
MIKRKDLEKLKRNNIVTSFDLNDETGFLKITFSDEVSKAAEVKEVWLGLRQMFITATEAGILLGLSPYGTPSSLLKAKKQPPVPLVSKFLDRGLEKEESVLKEASEWLQSPLTSTQGFCANIHTRISATPDGTLANGNLVEAKTSGIQNLMKWADNPPWYYVMQQQVQLYCTQSTTQPNYLMTHFFYGWPRESCILGASKMWKTTYSEEIMNILVDKVAEFWYALDNDITIRSVKKEVEERIALLKNTCMEYKGNIVMEKFEIDQFQLNIVRQTCLKASARINRDLPAKGVIEFAGLIEDEVFVDIGKSLDNGSKELMIQIGAAVNGYAESYRGGGIKELKDFVLQSLRFFNR